MFASLSKETSKSICRPNTLPRQFPPGYSPWYLDWGVPLAWPRGFLHAIVEDPRGRQIILLLRHLHFGIFGLFQLCSFFCGAFLTPAYLIIEGAEGDL